LPSFSQTQAASDGSRGVRLVYFAFDLRHLDGRDIASLPLIERKALLEPLVAAIPNLQFNDHETGEGELIRRHAGQLGHEGVVSKTINAPYAQATEGYGANRSASTARSSLSLAGPTSKGRGLISARSCSVTSSRMEGCFRGRVGTGMSERTLAALRLQPLAIKKTPLAAPPPRDNRFGRPLESAKAHWVRRELIVEITCLSWPDDGLLRHTVFVGLRENKPANGFGARGQAPDAIHPEPPSGGDIGMPP
jgi:ATP-dependent DNA ligase